MSAFITELDFIAKSEYLNLQEVLAGCISNVGHEEGTFQLSF